MRHEALKAAPVEPPPARELIWLVGQPPLTDYLDFVRKKMVGGSDVDARALVDRWRTANDHYHDLATAEAGIAETIQVRPLPQRLRPLEQEARQHGWFRRSFAELPTRFAMVELDKLIVSQTHVERGHHDAVAATLGRDLVRRFHFCIPTERVLPDVRIQRLDDHRWLFSSASTDLRERAPVMITGDRLADVSVEGPVAALLGLPVGFGSNFMSAVGSAGRLVLQNGYHRAYALRRAGITHAPCIIEDVTRKDELKVGGDEEVNSDPEFYFAAPRPPLLKDFFDDRFAQLLLVKRIDTVVEVEIKVRSGTATDWD